MQKSKILKFIIALLIPFSAGAIGSVATASSVSTWYQTLNKPLFNPPGWIFGPVWTLLYIMMGIAFFLAWSRENKKHEKKIAVGLFIIQMFFNSLWSIFFFGLRSPIFGLIDIIILLMLIIICTVQFFKLSKVSGYLMIPYILWVSFATILNSAVFILNK